MGKYGFPAQFTLTSTRLTVQHLPPESQKGRFQIGMSLDMFTFESTLDGSPTLRLTSADGATSEAMHSLRGAFSETRYIYGTAIETTLSRGFRPTILSMGLGLGYVEILATALLLKHGRLEEGEIESFESVLELRERLLWWLEGSAQCPISFAKAYDEILARTARELELNPMEIREGLLALRRDRRWRVRETLSPSTEFTTRFGCICFDAFSSKSTPELWTEEFLQALFYKTADADCVLSTYACTGALKRALRASGFALEIRSGFSSKRDSTFAVREAANLG